MYAETSLSIRHVELLSRKGVLASWQSVTVALDASWYQAHFRSIASLPAYDWVPPTNSKPESWSTRLLLALATLLTHWEYALFGKPVLNSSA